MIRPASNSATLALLLALLWTGAATAAPKADFSLLRVLPHDTGAFTQGLVYFRKHLYESTGLYGKSSLREVDLTSGIVKRSIKLPQTLFGEGLALYGTRLYQLTWQSGLAFVHDYDDFRHLKTFSYEGEGWGLTSDGQHLIMSDGSDTLTFRDPETFAIIRLLPVTDGGIPIPRLNELEYAGGLIFANVWQTPTIAAIDPETGQVAFWIDLSELISTYIAPELDESASAAEAVANGIAYNPATRTFFVTGKLWPRLFEIRLSPRTGFGLNDAGSQLPTFMRKED